MVTKAGFKVGPYSAESYDAAALTLLAMQASKSSEGSVFKNKIMEVANGRANRSFRRAGEGIEDPR